MVGSFGRDEVVAAQRGRNVGPRRALAPGEPRRLVLGVVLQQAQQRPDAQVLVGKVPDLGDAKGHEEGVIGDPLGKCRAPRIQSENAGLEAEDPLLEERLNQREGGGVARNDLVAHQLGKLRDRDSRAKC